jgi:DNA polymerase-3 subunit beta
MQKTARKHEAVEETVASEFRFQFPASTLREICSELRAVAPRNSTLPVLSYVLVERERGVTRFTATDLDIRLAYTLPSDLPEPRTELGQRLITLRSAREDGAVCVPFQHLAAASKAADKGSEITVTPTELRYRFGGNTATLGDFIPAVEFPPSFVRDLSTPSVMGEAAKHAMCAALSCASTDETRQILLGVMLDSAKDVVVATDGRQMVVFNAPLPPFGQIVIPSKAVRTLSRSIAHGPWTIAITKDKSEEGAAFEIHAGNWTLQSKLIEGAYPNWKQPIPKDNKNQTMIPLNDHVSTQIVDLLKRLPVSRSNNVDAVNLTIENSDLRFAVGDSSFTVNVAGNRQLQQTNAKREYWKRLIEIGCTEVRFENELSPIVGRKPGMIYVFMPVRIAK